MSQQHNIPLGPPLRSGPSRLQTSHLASSPSHQTDVVKRDAIVSKVLIKAVSKGKKNSGAKTFTLRNVSVTDINQLRALIRKQLLGEIIKGDFDIGYMKNTTVVTIRSNEDWTEILYSLRGGSSIMLWCNG